MFIRRAWFLSLALGAAALFGAAHAQEKKGAFASATEAYNKAVTYINQKNLPKAQGALEAALTLSPDEKLKSKIYRALLIPYDKDKDYTKFLATIEIVIRNPTSPAEKSLNRTDLIGFLQERKKEKEGADRYEEMLKKDPKDATALYILSDIHAKLLNNQERAAELTERLVAVTKESGGKLDVRTSEQLASQYVKIGKYKEGAEIYEKIAGEDDKGKSKHLKDAASAWLKAGDKEKALTAAKAASTAGLDAKTPKLNAHFWHRHLGEVFLETGEYKLSIQHLEQAIELTTNAGYKKDCQKKLEQAKQKLNK